MMQGRIDGLSGDVLRAWAWDPERPALRLEVRFLIAGQETETVLADAPRQDLLRAGIGDGEHGIRFKVPPAFMIGQACDVRLLGLGEDGGWVELSQRELHFDRPAAVLRGRVEMFRRGHCVGWVQDVQAPDRRVAVEAVWDGEVISRDIADRVRQDLITANIGDGGHGFEIAIPPSLWQFADPDKMLVVRMENGPEIGGLRLPTNDVLKSLVEIGRQAEREGDQAAAIRKLDEAIRLAPDNVDALWVRARIAAGQGDTEKARDLARRAYELHPSHARASVILARLAHNEGRYEEALQFWSQVSEHDSAYRESLLKSARALRHLGRESEVISRARRLLALNPEDIEGHQLLGEAYMALAAPTLAAPHLRAVAAARPQDRKIADRLHAAQSAAARPAAPRVPMEFLENPALRTWEGPAEGLLSAPTEVTRGVFLRPTNRRGQVRYRLCDAQEFRAGELPHYGLAVTAERAPAELGFRMDPQALDLLTGGMRIYMEARALSAEQVPVEVSLLLRSIGHHDIQRQLAVLESGARPRLWDFALHLAPEERAHFISGDSWIVLRIGAGASALLRAPRPLMREQTLTLQAAGPEGVSAAAYERLARMQTAR